MKKRHSQAVKEALRGDWATGRYTHKELARKHGVPCGSLCRILGAEVRPLGGRSREGLERRAADLLGQALALAQDAKAAPETVRGALWRDVALLALAAQKACERAGG